VDFDALYAILAVVARTPNGLITYGQLSQQYLAATGVDLPPHGSWDAPLGQLNTMLHAAGWPPLSAVVVLQTRDGGFGEPGGGFWESSPNIPPRPADPDVRTALWGQLLQQVYDAPWPATMPTAPPM
jgi:hypothetical protein